MPTQQGRVKAERLIMLESLLLNDPRRDWKTHEIAELLGVSDDTATHYLTELSGTGRVLLVTEGKTAGFTWRVSEESRAALPPLRLNYGQGAALYAAARLLSQQQGERNDVVRSALVALVRVLPPPLRPHLEILLTDLPRQDALSPADRSLIFAALSEGWLGRRKVELTYEPAHMSPYTCTFAPYLLEPSGIGYTLYFMGHSDPPGALRTYRLERIRSAQLTDEPFEVPTDFNGADLLRRSWGVMYGEGDPVHLKLRFNAFVSKRVRETVWHASQTLTETAEGLLWEADIGDVTEIRPWIRGWGADCEVLEPVELRDEMLAGARQLSRLYDRRKTQAAGDEPDQGLIDDLFGKD